MVKRKLLFVLETKGLLADQHSVYGTTEVPYTPEKACKSPSNSNFGAFEFEGEEYVQHRGLAMGSPLSPVMAPMFMETPEVDEFLPIMGTECEWYRYVDDVLVMLPNQYCENKLNELNSVEMEKENRYLSLIH